MKYLLLGVLVIVLIGSIGGILYLKRNVSPSPVSQIAPVVTGPVPTSHVPDYLSPPTPTLQKKKE